MSNGALPFPVTPRLDVRRWSQVASFLIIGYLCMSRSFAYLGIPPWHVFIGEVVLASFLLLGPKAATGRWPWVAMRDQSFRRLTQIFVVLMIYGVFQVYRGAGAGYPLSSAVRDLAFDLYPFYLFLGVWLGARSPEFPCKLMRYVTWFNGLYGVVFVLFLGNLGWIVPGVPQEVVDVPLFGQPLASAFSLVGLLAFERDLRSVWYLFALNLFVLLGMRIRGEWLAFAVGLLLWGWLTKRMKTLGLAGIYVLALIAIMYVVDFKVPGPETRGVGTISVRDLVGRAVAPINPDLAAEYTEDYQDALDSTLWRTIWWAQIWSSVHENSSRALLGFGYGYPIGDLVPYLEGHFIRTPHNFFLYALGYTGWIGALIFLTFQGLLARRLWKCWRFTRQPFGILFWSTSLVCACFTAFFETPYSAIPFYLIVGSVIGGSSSLRTESVEVTYGGGRQPDLPPLTKPELLV